MRKNCVAASPSLRRRGELIMGRVIEELKDITPVRFYGEDIA
jgi:hypothetical protein